MLRIFALKNTVFNDDRLFEERLQLADGNRREKVNSLVPREKKNASLAAGVILPLALKACGYAGEIRIDDGLWEKPRLVKPQGFCYNLSHSGEWTVIALSDGEVGVDAQQLRPVDMRLAKRFFTEEEWAAIEGAGYGAEQLFYRFWTVKESYLKALGVGLNRPLNSFSVRINQGGAKVYDRECDREWLVSEFDSLKGYTVAVCAGEYAPTDVEILHI